MDGIWARNPIISVIMPAYNAAQYIEKSIRSVQAQTFLNWELIVVDDCSEDNTVQTVTEMAQKDHRIRLYRNERNLGVAKSRNLGLELSKGNYVAFIDSDDLWYPEKLEFQRNCMQQTGADLVYTAYSIMNAEGRKICQDYHVPSEVNFTDMLKQNVIGCSTVMLRGATAKKYHFSEDFYHEDYVLWLEMLQDGCTAVGLNEVFVEYRFHEDSKAGNKNKAAFKRWKIYRSYLRFSFLKSIWYFSLYALYGLRKYKKIRAISG